MSKSNYWSAALNHRVTRRRALVTTGGTALGAAFLAACGGSSDSGGGGGGTKEAAASLMTKAEETSKQAVRGGTYKHWAPADITNFEPHITQVGGFGIFNECYSLMVRLKPGVNEPTKYEVKGDMAESWEWSPDGLTLSMKLRQGAGWAPVAPVNGRPVTIEDVAFTWKRFGQVGQNRGDYFNSVNPDSPVLSIATPDSRTITFNLKFPFSGMLANMGSTFKQAYIMPVEAANYDAKTTMVSSGAFYVEKYTPSVSYILKRNPNFYDKTMPYVDGVERPIITEYANGLAQLKAGAIYDYQTTANVSMVRGEDILPTKRDVPALKMYRSDPPGVSNIMWFGWKPSPAEKTPFRDERVRQALSMSFDRDAYIDAINNVSGFEKEGLPVEVRWSSGVDPVFDGWWVDPRDKKFGDNGKYYQHNIAEAKKLLAAAGHPNGLTATSNWPQMGYGGEYVRGIQILEGMAKEAGINFETNNPLFSTEWAPKYRDARGNFEGIAYVGSSVSSNDPIERAALDFLSYSQNLSFRGFDPNGRGDYSGDPALEGMITSARKETDLERKKAIALQVQQYHAQKLYTIRFPGTTSGLSLFWPAVKNAMVYRGEQMEYLELWLDKNEAPFKQ